VAVTIEGLYAMVCSSRLRGLKHAQHILLLGSRSNHLVLALVSGLLDTSCMQLKLEEFPREDLYKML